MYDKMSWFNPKAYYMFHTNILEYDMNAASLSISERFKLLPEATIVRLKSLSKKQRVIQTGLIRRDDKEFSKAVDKKMIEVRQQFIDENNIQEDHLLSLHSDAIIFASRKRIKSEIDGIKFKCSATSHGYMRYNGLEMFYHETFMDYKGGNKNLLEQQQMGITQYLLRIFRYIDNYDPEILDYMNKFQKNYLTDQLPEFVYPPFSLPGLNKYSNLDLFAFIAKVVLKEKASWE